MASRKEQKEALRRERLQRQAEADAAQRRRRLFGYAVGGVLGVAAVVAVMFALLAGDGGDGASSGSERLPEGGQVPSQRIADLRAAARAAGCQLRTVKARPPEHTTDPSERIAYNSKPPTNGRHFQEPAADGAYAEAPDVKTTVHSLEHGRVVFWFRQNAARETRADLKALFDEDSYQLLLSPAPPGMPYAIAASAWNGEPEPNGTGRLLGCPRFNERVFDVLRAFRDEHRGNGLEPIP